MITLGLLIGIVCLWGGSLIGVLFALFTAPVFDDQQIDGDEIDMTERTQDAPGTDAFFDYWGDW